MGKKQKEVVGENPTTKKAEVKVKVNFGALSKYTMIGQKKESIYKSAIFDGKTEKERKALRRKIRNTRDNIVEKFFNATKEEKTAIAKAWKEFAESVYLNTAIIFEANTTTDKIKDLAEFSSQIAKILENK